MDNLDQKEKILKLYGKVLVFIDWANVYGWSNGLGWEVDTKRLFNYLSEYPEIFEQRFYHGTEKREIRSVDFIKNVQNIGFKVVTKDVKKIPVLLENSHFKNIIKDLFNVLENIKRATFEMSTLSKLDTKISELQKILSSPIQRRKCDFDCEIVMDMMLKINDFDGIILFSGDGDYKAIIDYVLGKEKNAIIIHPYGKRGKELNELRYRTGKKPYFLPVEKLKEYIQKSPPEE